MTAVDFGSTTKVNTTLLVGRRNGMAGPMVMLASVVPEAQWSWSTWDGTRST